MARRKRKPFIIAEAMLSAEQEIRHAIEEKRGEINFYPCANKDGGSRGVKSSLSDRTAHAALKLNEEIESVFVFDVGTVLYPVKWLECFDRVREWARQCARPEIIFKEWEARYEKKVEFVFEFMQGGLDYLQTPDCYIMWIIYHLEKAAVEVDLMRGEQCSLYWQERPGEMKTKFLKTCNPMKDIK